MELSYSGFRTQATAEDKPPWTVVSTYLFSKVRQREARCAYCQLRIGLQGFPFQFWTEAVAINALSRESYRKRAWKRAEGRKDMLCRCHKLFGNPSPFLHVDTQIGNQSLQPRVFIFKNTQPFGLLPLFLDVNLSNGSHFSL